MSGGSCTTRLVVYARAACAASASAARCPAAPPPSSLRPCGRNASGLPVRPVGSNGHRTPSCPKRRRRSVGPSGRALPRRPRAFRSDAGEPRQCRLGPTARRRSLVATSCRWRPRTVSSPAARITRSVYCLPLCAHGSRAHSTGLVAPTTQASDGFVATNPGQSMSLKSRLPVLAGCNRRAAVRRTPELRGRTTVRCSSAVARWVVSQFEMSEFGWRRLY